jgi:nucleoside-diphosphate-sugar epimerase
MKKLLITGSNSLIGKSFLEKYRRFFLIKEVTRKHNIEKTLKSFKPEIVINLAGEAKKTAKMWDSNLVIVKKILDLQIKYKFKLISTGSAAEYGRRNIPLTETMSLNPQNIYESTKAAASMMIAGYSREFNLKSVIIRPHCVYGYYSKPDRLIPIIINKLKNAENLKIYRGVQDYVYVTDFIRFLFILIKSHKKWNPGEIINFGSGKQHTNLEVANKIKKIFKFKKNFKYYNFFNTKLSSDCWVCNNNLLKKKYKFKFKYSLNQGLEEIKKLYEKNSF